MLVRTGGNLPGETWLQGILEEGSEEAGAEDKVFFFSSLHQLEILERFQKRRKKKTETSLLQPPPPPPPFLLLLFLLNVGD